MLRWPFFRRLAVAGRGWHGYAPVSCLDPLERSPVSCDQVFPEVPLVLDHLVAEGAGHALGLHVDIDNVLLEIERVREGFPAVIAYPGLHAAPSVAWQVWSL